LQQNSTFTKTTISDIRCNLYNFSILASVIMVRINS
jgi:hypothetical protein